MAKSFTPEVKKRLLAADYLQLVVFLSGRAREIMKFGIVPSQSVVL